MSRSFVKKNRISSVKGEREDRERKKRSIERKIEGQREREKSIKRDKETERTAGKKPCN